MTASGRLYGETVKWIAVALAVFATTAGAQTTAPPIPTNSSWAERMALSEMRRTPDPRLLDFQTAPRWEYTNGVVLLAIDRVREKTGDRRYLEYVRSYYDKMVSADGTI